MKITVSQDYHPQQPFSSTSTEPTGSNGQEEDTEMKDSQSLPTEQQELSNNVADVRSTNCDQQDDSSSDYNKYTSVNDGVVTSSDQLNLNSTTFENNHLNYILMNNKKEFHEMQNQMVLDITEKIGSQLKQVMTQLFEPQMFTMEGKIKEMHEKVSKLESEKIEKVDLVELKDSILYQIRKSSFNNQLAFTSKQKEEFEREIKKLKEENESSSKSVDRLGKEKEQLLYERSTLLNNEQGNQKVIKERNQEIQRLQNEISNLQQRFNEMANESQIYKTQLEQTKKQLETLLFQKQKTEEAIVKGIVIDSAGEQRLEKIKKTLVAFKESIFLETGELSDEKADKLEAYIYLAICRAFINGKTLINRKQRAGSEFRSLVKNGLEKADVDGFIELIEKHITNIHNITEDAPNFKFEWFEKPDMNDISNFTSMPEITISNSRNPKVIYFSSVPAVYYGSKVSKKGEFVKMIFK